MVHLVQDLQKWKEGSRPDLRDMVGGMLGVEPYRRLEMGELI